MPDVLIIIVCVALPIVLIAWGGARMRGSDVAQESAISEMSEQSMLSQFPWHFPGVLYQYRLRPDGSSHFPYASNTANQLFDLTPQEMDENAENFFGRLHPEDAAIYRSRLLESGQNLSKWHAEYRIVFHDESVHWREESAMPERLPDGSVLWHGYAIDIDERKELESRKEWLVSALENSPVVITDLDANIEWVNPAFSALTGYSRDELVGQNPRMLKSGRHDDAFYQQMWQILTAGNVWRGDIVNCRKDRSLSFEEMMISPVKDASGNVHHYVGIKNDIADRKRMEDELRQQATTDWLTGLSNRRYFITRASAELARIKRNKAGMAVLFILDVDRFKRVNDTYGHCVGDKVLRHLAKLVAGTLRESDYSGRLGGEEFVVLLPETSVEQGMLFAERLRQKIETASVPTDQGELNYTISLGVTQMTGEDATFEETLDRADQALYRAKSEGRNRIQIL
ncbi:MAG: diguanylate cyclase/phosphodiesterase with sensor(s) [Burkholderiaceae bacterium]|nr:diguanylate cyclase/phosphodiesterase with sensor(s) [Burkholderiaceae bacterium]